MREVGFKIGKPIIEQVITNLREIMKTENVMRYYNAAEKETSSDSVASAIRITRSRSKMHSHSEMSIEQKNLEEVFMETLDLTIQEKKRRFEKYSDVLLALDSVYEFESLSLKPLEAVEIKISEYNELKFVKKFFEYAKCLNEISRSEE